jgi:hypothetical protein
VNKKCGNDRYTFKVVRWFRGVFAIAGDSTGFIKALGLEIVTGVSWCLAPLRPLAVLFFFSLVFLVGFALKLTFFELLVFPLGMSTNEREYASPSVNCGTYYYQSSNRFYQAVRCNDVQHMSITLTSKSISIKNYLA